MRRGISLKNKKLIWLLAAVSVIIGIRLIVTGLESVVCDIKGMVVFATFEQPDMPAGIYFYDGKTGDVSQLKLEGYTDLKYAAKCDENSFYCIGTNSNDNKMYALKVTSGKTEKSVLLGDSSVTVDALESYKNGILYIAEAVLYYVDFEASEKQIIWENIAKSDYYGYQLVANNSSALYCSENSVYLLKDNEKIKLDTALLKGDVCLGAFVSDDEVSIELAEHESNTDNASEHTFNISFSEYIYNISTGKLKKAPFRLRFYTSNQVINNGKTVIENHMDSAFGCWTDIVDVKTGLKKKADDKLWHLSDSAYDMF